MYGSSAGLSDLNASHFFSGNLGGEQEIAAIWAAVRLIRAGCRGLLRELTLLAQSAGILCDSTFASLQGSPALDISPAELRHCPVLPAEGASAALAAAVEASLPCPLPADEPEDAAWDAAASQQLTSGLANSLVADQPEVSVRVRDTHAHTRTMHVVVLTQSRRRRPVVVRSGLKTDSCSPCGMCAHSRATISAIRYAPHHRCFEFLLATCPATLKRRVPLSQRVLASADIPSFRHTGVTWRISGQSLLHGWRHR